MKLLIKLSAIIININTVKQVQVYRTIRQLTSKRRSLKIFKEASLHYIGINRGVIMIIKKSRIKSRKIVKFWILQHIKYRTRNIRQLITHSVNKILNTLTTKNRRIETNDRCPISLLKTINSLEKLVPNWFINMSKNNHLLLVILTAITILSAIYIIQLYPPNLFNLKSILNRSIIEAI